MATVRVRHPDDVVETFEAAKTEEMYTFGEMDVASVYADRDTINGVGFNPARDEVYIEDPEGSGDLFGGVLRDVVRSGGRPELVVDSFERLAKDDEPSPRPKIYDNQDDSYVVDRTLREVEIDAGNIETTATVSFVFPYQSPAKRIRATAEATGNEVLYNPDKTLDYGTRGENKTEGLTDIVLGPEQQNIDEKFDPTFDRGDNKVTHLVMLGAGEGDAQRSAHIVPNEDPKWYEGFPEYDGTYVQRYDHPNWTYPDERRYWETRIDKGITDQAMLAEEGLSLIEEFQTDHLDVDTIVVDHYVDLGDVWTLRHKEEGVDHNLRAAKVRRVIDKKGVRCHVNFSNRRLTRQTDADRIQQDVDRYNMAFEGTSVPLNITGGRQSVAPAYPYKLELDVPDDVVYEHKAQVRLKGFPYRTNINAAGKQRAAVSTLVQQRGGDESTFGTNWSHLHTFDPISSDTHTQSFQGYIRNLNTGSRMVYVRIRRSDGTYFPNSVGYSTRMGEDNTGFYVIPVGSQNEGDWFSVEMKTTVDNSTFNWDCYMAGSGHTHKPEPGIREFDGSENYGGDPFYPKDCDVLVNGTTVAEDIGSGLGEFHQTVDIKGHLDAGVNEVQVNTDERGDMQVYVEADVYRQILND